MLAKLPLIKIVKKSIVLSGIFITFYILINIEWAKQKSSGKLLFVAKGMEYTEANNMIKSLAFQKVSYKQSDPGQGAISTRKGTRWKGIGYNKKIFIHFLPK